jgi:hypothetical protein
MINDNSHTQVDEEEAELKQYGLIHRAIHGQLLTATFFTRYWLQIVVILAMVLIYITNRYSCQRDMEEIRSLNRRLCVVQTESYRVRGEYMSRIRESSMRATLDSMGIDLNVQTQPPYHLKAK